MAKRGLLNNFFGEESSETLDDVKEKIVDITKKTFKLKKLDELITEELEDWNEEYNSLISSLGIARSALIGIRNVQFESIKNLAWYGIGMKEVNESTLALYETFRSIYNINEDLINESAQMTRGWGISASESAEILRLQVEIFGMTKEQRLEQDKLIKGYGTIYGIGAGRLAKDIAANAEGIAKWSKNTGENLIKAAAFARKMGTEISKVLSFAEKLLDIEQSTQDAFSLQVLTGKTINVQRMRQLAFEGDHLALTKEITKQIESMSGPMYQNAIIQQQIADMYGMSIIEIRQIQKAHQQLNEELSGWNDKQKEIFKEYRNMRLIDPFQSEEAVSNITRLGEYFRAILLPIITKIVENLDNAAALVNKVLDPISKKMLSMTEDQKKAVAQASMIIPMLLLAKSVGGFIGGIFKFIFSGFKGFLSGVGNFVKKLGGMFGKGTTKGPTMLPKQILAYSAAIIAFAGGIWILSKAAQNFASVGDAFGQAMAGILISGTLLGGFVVLLSSLAPLAPGVLLISAAIITFAGGIWILSKASQNFVPLIEAISNSFVNMFTAIKGMSPAQLLGLSAGITSLGASLLLLTGTSFAAGLFGGGLLLTLKYLIELSKTADPLMKVATALEKISTNLYKINAIKNDNLSKNLNRLSTVTATTAAANINQPTKTQDRNVNINPANVYIDKYKVAEIVFETSEGRL